MTFTLSWSGKGSDFPGFADIVSPAAQTPAEKDHSRHVGHVVDHLAGEHPDEKVTISVTGWVTPQRHGGPATGVSVSVQTMAIAPEKAPEVEPASPEDAEGGPSPEQFSELFAGSSTIPNDGIRALP